MKKKNLGFWFGIIGTILLAASLISYFVILPLYMHDGLIMLVTYKYRCLMTISKYSAIFIGAFVLIYFALWGMNSEEIKQFKPLSKVDIFMLSFMVVSVISYFASPHKNIGINDERDSFFYEGPLWGTKGWCIGLVLILVMVGMYFATSRFFKYTHLIWIPILVATMAIFVMGICNRYDYYPIEIKGANASFLSTLGNINWFAGYQSVLTPIYYGLFLNAKNKIVKVILGISVFLADMLILLNGSDSIVFAFAITMFALLLISLKSEEKMADFCDLMLLFVAAEFGVMILDLILKGKRTMDWGIEEVFVKGPIPFILLILVLALRFYVSLCRLQRAKYPEVIKEKGSKIILICAGAVLALYVLLLIINTKTGGALPVIGRNKFFIFNEKWGSNRGATWLCGWYAFKDLKFIHKFIGIGPDMFYKAVYDSPQGADLANFVFSEQRLTNAHNELLTLLVNLGLFGLVSFVGLSVSGIKLFIEKAKENKYMLMFALSMIMYLSNNLFSFEQITNTPFYFFVIGIGAAAVVKETNITSVSEPQKLTKKR
ncbi:MAG: O-antigen ligase family protein [Lachnospiraceae bacterium]|nr:O-antigen ligase family protein [Lachnospiraceae bacterium]